MVSEVLPKVPDEERAAREGWVDMLRFGRDLPADTREKAEAVRMVAEKGKRAARMMRAARDKQDKIRDKEDQQRKRNWNSWQQGKGASEYSKNRFRPLLLPPTHFPMLASRQSHRQCGRLTVLSPKRLSRLQSFFFPRGRNYCRQLNWKWRPN